MADILQADSQRERRMAWDEELLDAKEFADVQVICKDRVWLLHKAILCTRCPWFDRKLSSSLSTEMATVTIDKPVEHVEWLIHFIYTGTDCSPPQLFQEEHFFTTCIALHDLGAYFSLPDLVDHAVSLLETHCRYHVTAFQQRAARQDQRGGRGGFVAVDYDYLRALLAGLDLAYRNELHRRHVRRVLVDYVYRVQTWLLNSQTFLDYMHKRPRFAMDLLCKRD